MANYLTWPKIRLLQRLSMVLTLGCCTYVIYFLFSKQQENVTAIESHDTAPNKGPQVSSIPVLSLKTYNAQDQIQDRDIFSPAEIVTPSAASEQTPKGQLPPNLKVVGVLISNPSQIIIEDTLLNQTFFIDEGTTQDGIKIVQVGKDKMVINYQGQDIPVPISKY